MKVFVVMLDAGYGSGQWIDGVFSSHDKAIEAGYDTTDIHEFEVDGGPE